MCLGEQDAAEERIAHSAPKVVDCLNTALAAGERTDMSFEACLFELPVQERKSGGDVVTVSG